MINFYNRTSVNIFEGISRQKMNGSSVVNAKLEIFVFDYRFGECLEWPGSMMANNVC